MKLTLLIMLLLSHSIQAAPDRLALVIGNASYKNESPLVNTLNDARDMAGKLESLGFQVTKIENQTYRNLNRSINQFIRQVQGSNATALIYYSGHGLQVNGRNYLLPIDAKITDEWDVPSEGVSLNRILGGLGGRGDKAVNLVVLDACRNNPFKKNGNKAIGDKGLARVKAPSGTLILYATRPGETASDNPSERNGLFTKHLLNAIDKPGQAVELTFKEVAKNVYENSGRRQSPWQEGVLFGNFTFRAGNQCNRQTELVLWQATETCNTPACYQNFLSTCPQGTFAATAQTRLNKTPEPPPPNPIKKLLVACNNHYAANRLTLPSGTNAFECYRQVLQTDPGNSQALQGLDQVAERYLNWAEDKLNQGNKPSARQYLQRAQTVSPEHPKIAQLIAQLDKVTPPPLGNTVVVKYFRTTEEVNFLLC